MAALDGQPGVHAVVKTVRMSPFGEFSTVYFDPTRTSADAVLARLVGHGCPETESVPGAIATAPSGQVLATALNPIVAPGDAIRVLLGPPADRAPDVVLPAGWSVVSDGEQIAAADDSRALYVQTAVGTPPGEYAIEVGRAGSAPVELVVTLAVFVQ